MSVSLHQIIAIAERVADEQLRQLIVVGIAASDGGTDRVELILLVGDDSSKDVRVVLNLSRRDPARFEADLRRKITELATTAG